MFSFATFSDGVPKKVRGNYVSAACVRCRTKKIKCDGQTPCANCQKKGVECVMSKKEPTKKIPPPPSKELINAASTVASAFFSYGSQRAMPTGAEQSPFGFGVTAGIYGGGAAAAAAAVPSSMVDGGASSASSSVSGGSGIPFSASKRSCIPPSSSSSANHGYGLSQPISLPDPISYLSAAALKDSLAAFNTICNSIIPIISARELFSERYMQSSRQKDPDAYAVWNGVVALGCFLSDGNKTLVDPIAATARDCLKDVFDSPSVDQSRALLLLSINELFSKRYLKARTYARMATVGSDTNPWFFAVIASGIRQLALCGVVYEGLNLAEDATMPLTFVPSEEALKYTTPDAPPLNWARVIDEIFRVGRYILLSPVVVQTVVDTFTPLPPEDLAYALEHLEKAEAMQRESNIGGPMACFFLATIYSARIDAYLYSGMVKEAAYWADKALNSWTPEELDRMQRIPFYFENIRTYAETVLSYGTQDGPIDYEALFNDIAALLPIYSAIQSVLNLKEDSSPSSILPPVGVDENCLRNEPKPSACGSSIVNNAPRSEGAANSSNDSGSVKSASKQNGIQSDATVIDLLFAQEEEKQRMYQQQIQQQQQLRVGNLVPPPSFFISSNTISNVEQDAATPPPTFDPPQQQQAAVDTVPLPSFFTDNTFRSMLNFESNIATSPADGPMLVSHDDEEGEGGRMMDFRGDSFDFGRQPSDHEEDRDKFLFLQSP